MVASDWPQWRFDSGRSASSPEVLSEKLSLVWKRDFPTRVQVWDDPLNHDLMTYDRILEPIVAEGIMFVGFNDSDKVVAFDIQTSAERWRYYTDGPVRFSPVAWGGKVYFISDDGYLYCLNAKEGTLAWKFRGAPGDQKVLGNERVISAWPARGGPVIRDGVLYFAASIWPFMGTFIYALDAETGEMEWVNDGTSAQYIKQPHNAPSFAGVAPQGALVATQDYLVVPGGRSVPSVFDRSSGEFKYFHLAAGGKGNGGSFVVANEQHFFAHTRLRGVRAYDLKTGDQTPFLVNEPVLDGEMVYAASDYPLRVARRSEAKSRMTSAKKAMTKAETAKKAALKLGDLKKVEKAETTLVEAEKLVIELESIVAAAEVEWRDEWKGELIQAFDSNSELLWELEADASGDLIKAGNRLYAAGKSTLSAFDLDEAGGKPSLSWSLPVKGTVQRLLVANQMLFAVTLEGTILAYAGPESTASQAKYAMDPVPAPESKWPIFEALLDGLDTKAGYALCYGLEDPRLLDILLRETDFHIVGVDSDLERIETLRYLYDEDHSVYGKRIALQHGDPLEFNAPPYFASLVTIDGGMLEEIWKEEFLDAAYSSVRPYGGNLWISGSDDELPALRSTAESMQLEQAVIDTFSFSVARSGNKGGNSSSILDSILQLTRKGALPGSADWTHHYGDIANTVKSDDQRVKLPLGLLWFGGSSNMDVLPRHGHGPPEQVIGGRTIIEGMDSISARDVYTGRVMWKRTIANLDTYGIYFNESYADTPLSTSYNQGHLPGANGRGSNYVATEEAVYVALEDYCEVLDSETGDTINYIRLPLKKGGAVRPRWGFIGVYKDLLLGGHDFAHFTKKAGREWKKGYAPIEDLSASAGLVAFDRHSGDLRWQVSPRHGFIHNGIVAGNGRVYCLDKLPESAEAKLRRRGRSSPSTYRIAAFDYETGEQLWEVTKNIFGSWLGYSEEHDILLQAGADAKDRLSDEIGDGMIAYQGRTGAVLWEDLERQYNGPCIIHNDLILTSANSYSVSAGAYNLLDGTPHWIVNPLTGKEEPWLFTRAYGCNTPVAGEHMLTFRSGAAGYYDLAGQSGTGNLGGFRSSCTSNLVIANGVLNAPDYTRTCSCGYQNQTSLALIHMPDVEMWTFSTLGSDAMDGEFVKQAGINFGAPGDRRAENGTLWLDFPSVGGDSPEISVVTEGEDAHYFRHHSARFRGEGLTWVAASGIEDVEKLIVTPIMRKTVKGDKKASVAVDDPTIQSEIESELLYYTVRLHFSEPEKLEQGDRLFHVSLQGERVLESFDVIKESGGYCRALVKEFPGVGVQDVLEIQLTSVSETGSGTIISGLELIAE
jgi:outer membrane protein assembly factor BamB